MKRYWILMAMVPLIAAGIGSYYLQAAADEWPDYVLERVSGDAQTAAGLHLQATYQSGQLREPVSISEDGSEYPQNSSIVNQMSRAFVWTPEWEALTQQYRGFMRGKSPNPMQMYQDDKQLVYAEVDLAPSGGKNGYRFRLSVLDKKSGQTKDIQATLPGGENYSNVYVRDVRVVDGQFKILSFDRNKTAGEPHLYTIAADGSSQIRDQLLTSGQPANPDIETTMQMIDTADMMGSSPYLVLWTKQIRHLPNQGGSSLVGQRLTLYDLKTGEEVKIESNDVMDVLAPDGGNLVRVIAEGDSMYLVSQDNQSIRVVDYDIATKKTVAWVFPTPLRNYQIQIEHGRLFMMYGLEVRIVEVATGDELYEGHIVLKDAHGHTDNPLGNLSLNGMTFD